MGCPPGRIKAVNGDKNLFIRSISFSRNSTSLMDSCGSLFKDFSESADTKLSAIKSFSMMCKRFFLLIKSSNKGSTRLFFPLFHNEKLSAHHSNSFLSAYCVGDTVFSGQAIAFVDNNYDKYKLKCKIAMWFELRLNV